MASSFACTLAQRENEVIVARRGKAWRGVLAVLVPGQGQWRGGARRGAGGRGIVG